MEKPIVRSTLRQAVREAVVARVNAGQLGPGARINETRLARELGVSATPVREALMSLEGCGYLSATPGKGFVVSQMRADEVRDIFSTLALLDSAALLRCGPFSESQLSRLRALNQRFRKARGAAASLDADELWHTALVSGCPNAYLLQLISGARFAGQRYEFAFLQQVTDINASADQHEEVIAALERGDVDGAANGLADNWLRVIEKLVPRL